MLYKYAKHIKNMRANPPVYVFKWCQKTPVSHWCVECAVIQTQKQQKHTNKTKQKKKKKKKKKKKT